MEVDTWSRGVSGPLAQYAVGYAGELHRLGYTQDAAQKQLGLLAHLSRWLDREGLKVQEITDAAIKGYLQARRDAGYTHFLATRAPQRLLAYLRELGVVPEPVAPEGPVDELLGRYRAYLSEERGLAARTITV